MLHKPLYRVYSSNCNAIFKIWEGLVTLLYDSMEYSRSINTNDSLYYNYLFTFYSLIFEILNSLRAITLLIFVSPLLITLKVLSLCLLNKQKNTRKHSLC